MWHSFHLKSSNRNEEGMRTDMNRSTNFPPCLHDAETSFLRFWYFICIVFPPLFCLPVLFSFLRGVIEFRKAGKGGKIQYKWNNKNEETTLLWHVDKGKNWWTCSYLFACSRTETLLACCATGSLLGAACRHGHNLTDNGHTTNVKGTVEPNHRPKCYQETEIRYDQKVFTQLMEVRKKQRK